MTSIKDNRHPFKYIFLIKVHVLVQSSKYEYVLRPPSDSDWHKQGIRYLPFLLISENSFDQLVGKFQKSLQHHYESSNALPLYDPGLMKKFADKSAPGLFNVILQSILREDPRLSEEHRVLEEKRTVVLLHIIAYFRYFALNTGPLKRP